MVAGCSSWWGFSGHLQRQLRTPIWLLKNAGAKTWSPSSGWGRRTTAAREQQRGREEEVVQRGKNGEEKFHNSVKVIEISTFRLDSPIFKILIFYIKLGRIFLMLWNCNHKVFTSIYVGKLSFFNLDFSKKYYIVRIPKPLFK